MKLKYISWLPAFIIMVIIFIFSSQPATTSDATSLGFADEVYRIYETIVDSPPTNKQAVLDNLNLYIRKLAHCVEYAILCFFIAFHLWACKKEKSTIFLLAIFISFLYAASDETHQLFVVGRSGEVRDVMIDTIGALFGSAIFIYISPLLNRLKDKLLPND